VTRKDRTASFRLRSRWHTRAAPTPHAIRAPAAQIVAPTDLDLGCPQRYPNRYPNRYPKLFPTASPTDLHHEILLLLVRHLALAPLLARLPAFRLAAGRIGCLGRGGCRLGRAGGVAVGLICFEVLLGRRV
jgi:hypothetical protein